MDYSAPQFVGICTAIALTVVTNARSHADITPIAQFTGQWSENFDEFPADGAFRSLNLFGGHGSVRVEGDNNSIKLEWYSSLGGDEVIPISNLMCGQLGIADWEFQQPVMRFGGFWENNSHADDATAEFFDAGDTLIGTRVVPVSATAQHWVWNGWQFDTPVSRIRVTGNGLINGFIWYENMEITPAPVVPEPGSLLVLPLASIIARRRGR